MGSAFFSWGFLFQTIVLLAPTPFRCLRCGGIQGKPVLFILASFLKYLASEAPRLLFVGSVNQQPSWFLPLFFFCLHLHLYLFVIGLLGFFIKYQVQEMLALIPIPPIPGVFTHEMVLLQLYMYYQISASICWERQTQPLGCAQTIHVWW